MGLDHRLHPNRRETAILTSGSEVNLLASCPTNKTGEASGHRVTAWFVHVGTGTHLSGNRVNQDSVK